MNSLKRIKGFYVSVMVSVWFVIETLYPGLLSAQNQGWDRNTNFTGTNKNIRDFSSSLAEIVMYAILAISFVVGAGMVTMGLVGFAQKRDNPEAAQGAPRKIMAGGALLAITIIIGVLKATLFSAG